VRGFAHLRRRANIAAGCRNVRSSERDAIGEHIVHGLRIRKTSAKTNESEDEKRTNERIYGNASDKPHN
jgi:hypothetical protein